jgi:hypothetical protein
MSLRRAVEVQLLHSWPWHKTNITRQLHALVGLSPGKTPQLLTGWEAGWAPDSVWTLWSRKQFIFPAGNRTLVVQLLLMAIPTELSRLHIVIIIIIIIIIMTVPVV